MALTTFTSGTGIASAPMNANFLYVNNNTPIGCVFSWLKNYTNTPALPEQWVECNGQTLSDAESPYNGQVIPDLNGGNRFLRGNTTSGGTGGSETHTHTVSNNGWGKTSSGADGRLLTSNTQYAYSSTTGINTGSTSTLPSYYEVVWIMRVK